ncbi:Spy/CpxP family protein refolding chaperone [uncultured Algoriphagus sp.]|uniref:Spy/CpxP family protein refolding chaperone n=1 Tax=uncultured Algoriphagus sp. TaxID=417365 RepID=UPI0030ED71C9|tara:strand:+ start:39373 stop:40158 length:786 start_codon:yes stop_codon:yes gene_type:complete
MKKILFVYLLCFAGFVHGQQTYVHNLKASNQDIFQRNLYSADHVMELRSELKLTDAQTNNIKKIHSENAGKFSTVKWDLDEETKKLKELLDETKIDQVAVQKQMDKVLALENSLKKQQLSTMVAIKNELTSEQQEILQTTRVQTVNGVSISGYGSNTFSPATVNGISSGYKVGKPLYEVAGVGSISSPKVIVHSSSPNQEDAPLYILDTKDGMKQLSNFNKINPDDIESINVLKNESATDTYGEKGKNGVIIIKLKENRKK